ncbi:MAG: hypothetical protein GPJ54_16285 [Candidatus Heimdallarchaeota archaeon]|nr:hypothetical protein [Candidatus Heimdallarchaeota archaeon]
MAAIVGFGSIYYIEGQDQISLPTSTQTTLALIVFLVAFTGGFMAPYHVMKTARTGAITFGTLAGIPLVIILAATGEISQDDNADVGSILILILLLVVAIALVISIVVVTVLLFIGGYIGSIFGKMVFDRAQYEDNSRPAKYGDHGR